MSDSEPNIIPDKSRDAKRDGGNWRTEKPHFKSAHVEWGTPPDLKTALEKEFHFTLDPCVPGQLWDGCAMSWANQRVFCNPPYGRGLDKWLAKGREATLAVFLLPARTDTNWFHDYALGADEIRFFRGRLKFREGHAEKAEGFANNAAPFPSMLVIFSQECLSSNADISGSAGAFSSCEEKYQELIYAVGNKYQGESRHETALRHIKNAEHNYDSLPSLGSTASKYAEGS